VVKLPSFDSVEYLVDRKFGIFSESISISAERRARTDPKIAKQIAAYKNELLQLSREELGTRVETEREKERARDEQQRFFSQPDANADFAHWSKAVHWTLDEAIALSFGKAPERVTWESVKPYVQVSAFALQYQRRRDLARRAVAWKQLFDPVLPGIFMAWAKRNDFAVPPELETAVASRGVQVADWKTMFEDLKNKFEEHHEKWMEICDQKDNLIENLRQQEQDLEARLESATAAAPAEKALGTRERDSLLKLVIGMAVAGYGYDPATSRSERPSEIAGDLATVGVPLDADTVRKWLKAAAELLPPKPTE
jgi:hypothetical protein